MSGLPVNTIIAGDCLDSMAAMPDRSVDLVFCPPGGIVLDCFCGSGTTLAAAIKAGRQFIGLDVRQSQVALSMRRVAEARKQQAQQLLFAEADQCP